MKISLKSISALNYMYETGFDPYDFDVEEIIKRIGLQLGAIEAVEDYREWYKDAVVVKVVTCEKHPNADKLSVCMIDDGGKVENLDRDGNGLIQVVCGAPNVHADMWAVWLPPLSIVPASRREEKPFELEAREIRGKVSNGMLASPKELDISDNHDGILELEGDGRYEDLHPGKPFEHVMDVADVVIELENKMFTHRPDCFGELGVARELSGIFGQQFSSPDWYKTPTIDNRALAKRNESLPVEVSNEVGDKVPRFMIQSVANIEFEEDFLNLKLRRVGIKSINSVVDYTNYFMHMTGQPLHAYDYDKVKALSGGDTPVIKTRFAKKGEKIKLLNGKIIELEDSDVVIATDKVPIGIAGVMGGSETEVDVNTKNIILECGTFDMYSIRRTSMRHGLFTDAVTRFNKGQSPLQNDRVLAKITDWCWGHLKGTIASPTYDLTSFDVNSDNLNRVEVKLNFINARLGTHLEFGEVMKMLNNVEFQAAYVHDDSPEDDPTMLVTVPFWRMDIAIPEDIVEEVGRLYSYSHVPVELPKRTSKPAAKNALRSFKNTIRNTLSSRGANEVLTYSFVHGDLMKHTGTDPDEWAYHLRNAISPDLQYYRTSLVPSLLSKVNGNIRANSGKSDNAFALFELGKVHVKGHTEEGNFLPKEYPRLAFVIAADRKTASSYSKDPFYHAKMYLESIIKGQAEYLPLDTNKYPITAPFQKGRAAVVEMNGQAIGVVGEIRSEVLAKLKLPDYCAAFEIDIKLLQEHLKESRYQELSLFPSTHQDITLEVDGSAEWNKVEKLLHAELEVQSAENDVEYVLHSSDIFRPEGSDKKRVSFTLEFYSKKRTLQTSEINDILSSIEKVAHETLGATRI